MELKYIKESLRSLFSFSFLNSIFHSFGYYLHEHVTWRYKIRHGKKLRVHSTASIRNAQNIEIGHNSHINQFCCIWCGKNSKIFLGDNLLMGPSVKIFSTNHGYSLDTPMTFQPSQEADIIVGDDCWLGANVVVLKGVKIPNGCIIAAGSVVTKSLPEEYCIYGGIPAKKIKSRKKNNDE